MKLLLLKKGIFYVIEKKKIEEVQELDNEALSQASGGKVGYVGYAMGAIWNIYDDATGTIKTIKGFYEDALKLDKEVNNK